MSQKKNEEIPKDLGLKVGTPAEAVWTNVLKSAENSIKQAEEMIMVNREIVLLAKRKVSEEQRKAK